MPTRVKLDYRGVGRLLKSSGTRAMLTDRADTVLSAAESSAPRDTGDYASSLRIEQDTTDRAVVRVVADVDYAFFVEAQTGTLARALAGADGLVEYTSKAGKKSRITQAQADNYSGVNR